MEPREEGLMVTVFTLTQILLFAFAYMPGVTEPARGAFLLMSFWCFGATLGARFAGRGGDH